MITTGIDTTIVASLYVPGWTMIVPPRATMASASRMLRIGPLTDTFTTMGAVRAFKGALRVDAIAGTDHSIARMPSAMVPDQWRSKLRVSMETGPQYLRAQRCDHSNGTQTECNQREPCTGVGPRYGREVQQLLHADQRWLVVHSRYLDYCVRKIDVVAVVIFPSPEIDQTGHSYHRETSHPREKEFSTSYSGGDEPKQYQTTYDPRHEAELRNRRGSDVLHPDVMVQAVDVVEIVRRGPTDIAYANPHPESFRILRSDQLDPPKWNDEESRQRNRSDCCERACKA